MRVERERSPGTSRWSIETTGAIDRAIAVLFTAATLGCAHVLGLDADLLRLAQHLF